MNLRCIQLVLVFAPFVILMSCKKGGTDGKASIIIFPERDLLGNGNLVAVKGATVYVWFDGSNTEGGILSIPRNTETADLKIVGDTNEIFVTIPSLKTGSYAWRVLAPNPSSFLRFNAFGDKDIKWHERKDKIVIHNTLK